MYIVIKRKLYPLGVEYFLRILLKEDIFAEEIDCFARENGVTGIRDATIYGMLGIKHFDGWMKDPYDENYIRGFLMNLSEDRKYDEMFPEHPLSEIRRVLDYIISNN